MKSLILILGFFFSISTLSFSQTEKVEWKADITELKDNTYKIVLTADVAEGWYIYSQYMEQGGPIPTEISFEGKGIELEGKTEESGDIEKEMFDEVFEIDIKKFGKKARFSQIVKTNGAVSNIKAFVTFMSCNDERCNPPSKVELDIKI